MQKFLTAGAILLLLASGANAAQDPAKVYGPTLNKYAEITCKLQKTRMGNKYQRMQLKQMKLMNKLHLQTAKLAPEQRVQYNKAYTEAMSCAKPKDSHLTAKKLEKMGCNESADEQLAAMSKDSKWKQKIAKQKWLKKDVEKHNAAIRAHAEEQRELRGGGYDPCAEKEYDPYENIPD